MQSLQPYFPASDPETHAQLLSGLYKSLQGLKDDGVFSKDVSVSKPVLQDCKGSRFERLLAELSMQVVYRRIVGDHDDKSAARQVLHSGNPLRQSQTAPMRLAYKHALKGQLRERAVIDRRWHKFSRALTTRSEALHLEEQLADVAGSPKKDKRLPRRTLDRLHKHIESNWTGDAEWVDALLFGDQHGSQDQLLEHPFEDVWDHATKDTLYTIRAEQTGSVLRDLERRVQEQSSRLEKWKSMLKEPLTSAASTAQPKGRPPDSLSGESSWEDLSSLKNELSGNEERREHVPVVESRAGRLNANECVSGENPDKEAKNAWQGPAESFDEATPRERKHERVYHLRSRAGNTSKHMSRTSTVQQDPGDLERPEVKDAKVEHYPPEAFDKDLSELKPLPSLAERTRMSMALASPSKQDQSAASSTRPVLAPLGRPVSAGRVKQIGQLDLSEQMDNLADRARQSMNIMPAKTPAPRRPRKMRTSSADFTKSSGPPKKTQTAADVDTTLLEETIQNLGTDYESVFKSRPRIAVSPVLSPQSGGRGIAEVLDLNGHASGEEDDFS